METRRDTYSGSAFCQISAYAPIFIPAVSASTLTMVAGERAAKSFSDCVSVQASESSTAMRRSCKLLAFATRTSSGRAPLYCLTQLSAAGLRLGFTVPASERTWTITPSGASTAKSVSALASAYGSTISTLRRAAAITFDTAASAENDSPTAMNAPCDAAGAAISALANARWTVAAIVCAFMPRSAESNPSTETVKEMRSTDHPNTASTSTAARPSHWFVSAVMGPGRFRSGIVSTRRPKWIYSDSGSRRMARILGGNMRIMPRLVRPTGLRRRSKLSMPV